MKEAASKKANMRISSSLTRMCCPVRRMRYTLPRLRLPILRERRFTLHDHCLKQLGIEARRGSITPGKDADFLVFDNDLLTAAQAGFSYNEPTAVYIGGKKVNQ